ncbi:inositol monophosphatase family protein [Oceanobacillus bengalensis]|uniref:Inositol monophosphatase family protein n=1 Tax=Oceanobacillus bengalensis TaxID=1435466 RepID=A0A494Z1K1_9BACI|nr:inositol monophosphatase family protein [Oceanobacillus bengalensis]RKQ16347.1 inositol monophosphatase family protein [Oceanobacillus bengalensis]
MDSNLRNEIYTKGLQWIKQAGENIRTKINNPLVVDTKSNPNDLVTTMDRETESFFVTKIKETYPEHAIVGEEGYGDKLSSMDGTVWVIDPIDGTMNFVHQKRNFAISVGIYQDGIGEIGFIYDVMSDILYHAKRNEGAYKDNVKLPSLKTDTNITEAIIAMNHFWLCPNKLVDEEVMQHFVRTIRGTRVYGSAALEFAFAAEGIINGYISMGLSPWDIAAGIIIFNEVGGVTTTIDGTPINMLEKNTILACNLVLQDEILSTVKEGRKSDAI